jgi:Domain of unknown function (DUF4268)
VTAAAAEVVSNGSPPVPTAPAAVPVQPATFGRLERAKVRDYWVDEARDFTPWLAQETNLNLLGETVELSLELVGIEQRVGPFKADIVATDGEHTVIIENQLDPTDHKHLGQLLVYAAGRNAKTVVWVAKEVTDEYRKVIDWLNEETSVNFWALEIELWRIGGSPVAPKFNVVCAPNELTKDPEVDELSDTKLLQLEFWKGFNEFLEGSGSSFNARKARAQHWYDLSIGTTRAHIYLNAVVMGAGRLVCGLYVKSSQSSLIFEKLAADRGAIDSELGFTEEVDWAPNPEKLACRIGIHRPANIADRDSWPELFAWLKNNAERFKTVFAGRVKDMELPSSDGQMVADAVAEEAAGENASSPPAAIAPPGTPGG